MKIMNQNSSPSVEGGSATRWSYGMVMMEVDKRSGVCGEVRGGSDRFTVVYYGGGRFDVWLMEEDEEEGRWR